MPLYAKQRRIHTLQRHAARLKRAQARLAQVDRRFFWARLTTVLGVILFASLALAGLWNGLWIAPTLFALAFTAIVFQHRRLDRIRRRFDLAFQLTSTQIARTGLDWEHIPLPPPAALPTGHPFAGDLNLVGEKSLHQLIDTAASKGGSQRLHDWLITPIPVIEEIQTRQALLAETRDLAGFRRSLALSGLMVAAGKRDLWDGEKLLSWLKARHSGGSVLGFIWLLGGLALANLVLFLLSAAGNLPAFWLGGLALYGLLYNLKMNELRELFDHAYHLDKTLTQFRAVLDTLEHYPYQPGSQLAQQCQPFWQRESRPSAYLRRLAWIASAASLRYNQFVWFFVNLLLPWDLIFVHLLNQAKADLQNLLPAWLDAWYELEALNSLANYAYLNPDTIYPTILPAHQAGLQPVFKTRSLGHPLIPDERRVCNDFSIQNLGEAVLVTGSNMSGKSTFLRTLGANLCLAFAGGPVTATTFETLPFRLFTCISVGDSLSDGISYFYAEVKRLKALLAALQLEHPYPLFFLIDEIFRGTNNREREIGSRAYVRALAGAHAVGCISTHDLELTHLAQDIPQFSNLHFREEVVHGRLDFDFKLRPGPCPTTNALKIMQMEGLPVPGIASEN